MVLIHSFAPANEHRNGTHGRHRKYSPLFDLLYGDVNRRKALAAVTSAGTVALAGCVGEIGAMAGSVKNRITGHVSEPRKITVRNEGANPHTITLIVKDANNETRFENEFRVEPDTTVENAWQTSRVGRYTVTVETDSGLTASGEMNVCVGFLDFLIIVYTDSIEAGQGHGDPTAAHCSVS